MAHWHLPSSHKVDLDHECSRNVCTSAWLTIQPKMVVEFEVDVSHQGVSDPFSVTTRTETTNPPICLAESGVSTLPSWPPAEFLCGSRGPRNQNTSIASRPPSMQQQEQERHKSHGGQEDTQNAAPKKKFGPRIPGCGCKLIRTLGYNYGGTGCMWAGNISPQ